MVDPIEFLDTVFWIKLGWAIGCGFIVGLERHLHKKPVDIRMGVLICVGTMLFIHLGNSVLGNGDPTRVLGQVVTGIGFLGAGVIMTRQGAVLGLTSAATVWVLSAIGAAIGFEMYEIAISTSVVTVLLLIVFQWLEDLALKAAKKANPKS